MRRQDMKGRLKANWKGALVGVAMIGVGFWFSVAWAVDTWNQYRLATHGITVHGYVVDVWEDATDNDSGGMSWSYGAEYTYRVDDGRVLKGHTSGSGQAVYSLPLGNGALPIPILVEYLPDHPGVSRIKGERPDSLVGLLRHDAQYPLMASLLFGFGGWILHISFRDEDKVATN